MESTLTRWIVVLIAIGVGSGGILAAQSQPSSAPAAAPTAPAQAVSDASQKPAAEAPAAPSIPAWVKGIKISGDFRYRHELTDDETKTADRNRHRLRARLYVSGKVNDEIDAMIGLASGSDESATNTNQEETGAFSSKPLWLDLAFFDYHPASVEGLHVLGGKIKQPYYFPGDSDLLFDTDVRPEGIAATYKKNLAEGLEFFGIVAGHYVQERSTEADTSLWVAQAGLTCALPGIKDGFVTGGAGYYDYANTQGEIALGENPANFRGNTSVGGVYASDFDIVQVFGEAGLPLAGLPFSVFGELLVNTAAESDEDTGYLVGASLGKCKDPKSWQVAYNYRDLEADAALAALTESTFAGGGTGLKGHKLSVGYQIAKNWNVVLCYMMAERVRAQTTDFDVFILDLNFKF
ncbi:MAG TPA: putative porin [Sedimentisphaerales bacterium]|nr:putative porin [Sedimentisphaerales bacterium]